MTHLEHVARVEAEISALEALVGTPEELPNTPGLLALLDKRRTWHLLRCDTPHPNLGRGSLFPRCSKGHTSRYVKRRVHPFNEHPAVSLP